MNDIVKTEMNVINTKVSVIRVGEGEYISLTDLARYKNPIEPKDVVKNWMRSHTTMEFLGLWEKLNNENAKGVEIDAFINEAGYNSFTMSPQRWIKEVNAIGIISKSGNNGGTYAHADIALEFASWLSPEFKIYLIKEFERLKKNEAYQHEIDWSANRMLAKVNYRLHTDAIKENVVPYLTESQKKFIYANEADVLNVALFGMTSKQWKEKYPNLKGNMRDNTDLEHLLILCNLENTNAELINDNIPQRVRLEKLNRSAIRQMKILEDDKNIKNLEQLNSTQNKQLIEHK